MKRDDLRRAALGLGGHRTASDREIVAHLLWSASNPQTGGSGQREAEAELARLRATGLPCDPGGHADLAAAINLLTANGMDDPASYWRRGLVATGRRLVGQLVGNDPAPLPGATRRFSVSFARRFHGLSGAGGRLRLRLPRPIEDAALFALSIAHDASAKLLPGRIETVLAGDGADTIALAARYDFTARSAVPSLDAPSALWLAPNEGLIRVTSRVRALAAQLAGGLPPAKAARRFFDHLLDAFGCGMVHHDRIGDAPASDWVLDHGWYDCLLGAALFAALCRARGIPARMVGGYLLWDAPAEHYWAEAWLPGEGWMPFDLLVWGLSAGGVDRAWRDLYAGGLDFRMKTQVWPGDFIGWPGGVRSAGVQRLCSTTLGGTRMRFVAAADGRPLYTDEIRVVTA